MSTDRHASSRPSWSCPRRAASRPIHRGWRLGPTVHRIGQRSVQLAAVLPQSATEVVKVTNSVPAAGIVVKAGAANAVGAYGERLAARYLTESGMHILDRNWRCDQGEIDIVAMDDTALVIVEVKTRRTLAFGPPVEAVTAVKAARLRRLACCWLTVRRRFGIGTP